MRTWALASSTKRSDQVSAYSVFAARMPAYVCRLDSTASAIQHLRPPSNPSLVKVRSMFQYIVTC